ncbi:uncharacterized protein KGF55_002171 [Candida pseudojiufengensis]|uniref:uncharacterized protein n=1 Tax=Candida pseudojiufengensis TaxID=497109 RepID=UPI00222515F9|nr:uncharacterized protein KGF55_002171 [Candida pseudojiufengensis]KAI5964229.1 hypothetical protein KGF55_002171 [Candida pseudojiufengensis]
MFKKPPTSKASANIKSSDRRKLLATICKTYNLPLDEISKEGLENILPSISKKATFITSTGVTGILYLNEQELPTWFQTRDSQLYPSILTCWKCPYLLPLVKTHPHVIDVYLGKGADLMLPGTIPPFDKRATKHTVVGVVSSDSPNRIMAIGTCNLNLTQFDNVVGRSGTAVNILHHYNDELMKLNKEIDIEIPETVDEVIPKKEVENESKEDVVQETESNEPVEEANNEEAIQGTSQNEVDEDDLAEEVATLTVEELDNFFIRSLLQTIKLEKLELPMSSNVFSTFIYKNLPIMDSKYANIKKTSWKKISKFLKEMKKLKYLDIKGKDEDLTIISLISKDSSVIENFVPHKINKPKTSNNGNSNKSSMTIRTLYKPTSKSRMFFNKINEEYDELYTLGELKSKFENYIKQFKLPIENNPKNIILDEIISKPINKSEGTTMARDEAFKEFLINFSPYYEIISKNDNQPQKIISKGVPPKIHIVTEIKIGRKIITRIGNYDKFFLKQGLFSEELRIKCSGSTTILEDDQIQVQGPHGLLIIEILKGKGIPISCIEFIDKVKKKKKRS